MVSLAVGLARTEPNGTKGYVHGAPGIGGARRGWEVLIRQ